MEGRFTSAVDWVRNYVTNEAKQIGAQWGRDYIIESIANSFNSSRESTGSAIQDLTPFLWLYFEFGNSFPEEFEVLQSRRLAFQSSTQCEMDLAMLGIIESIRGLYDEGEIEEQAERCFLQLAGMEDQVFDACIAHLAGPVLPLRATRVTALVLERLGGLGRFGDGSVAGVEKATKDAESILHSEAEAALHSIDEFGKHTAETVDSAIDALAREWPTKRRIVRRSRSARRALFGPHAS